MLDMTTPNPRCYVTFAGSAERILFAGTPEQAALDAARCYHPSCVYVSTRNGKTYSATNRRRGVNRRSCAFTVEVAHG